MRPEQITAKSGYLEKTPHPALCFNSIHYRYGSFAALSGLDLQVWPGEVVCLVGPSGCGKTTALRLAAGFEMPALGKIDLFGQPASRPDFVLPPEKRGIGMVFQDYALFPHLTVAQNIGFGLDTSRTTAHENDQRIQQVLAHLSLDGLADRYPYQLSGGQQQRVALGRVLAPSPQLLLLDEPFSGLDARLREDIRDQTLHLLRESGAAILMVTHDPEEAMFMADRIIVLNHGKVEQEGTPEHLYMEPENPFVANFLGEVNNIQGTCKDGVCKTVLGDFAVTPSPEQQEALLMIRPEGLHLFDIEKESGNVPYMGTVVLTRMLGRTVLVHFETEIDGQVLHLHARTPNILSMKPGQRIGFSIDPRLVFTFLDKDQKSL